MFKEMLWIWNSPRWTTFIRNNFLSEIPGVMHVYPYYKKIFKVNQKRTIDFLDASITSYIAFNCGCQVVDDNLLLNAITE
jgi:hypothetical protein